MNFGFNTNVRVGSVVYHVQSEDRGPAHPFLDTSVYDGGRVVYRRSTNYTDLAGLATDTEARQQILHERLTQQHRDVIAQLQAGTLPLGPQAGTQAQPVQKSDPPDSPGLEVRLLNPRSWLSAGNATLEVEVRTSGGASVVPGAKVEASIEASNGDSVAFRTHADPLGRATLSFPIPSILGDGAALTIRATSGALSKELSFRLRARPAETAPAPSLK
jgi:hypothetical protein